MRILAYGLRGIRDLSQLWPVRRNRRAALSTALVAGAMLAGIAAVNGQFPYFTRFIPNGIFFPNPNGASQTYSANGGGIDLTGPFFQSLGTNGRTCGTCHQPSDGMSVSAANVELRFLLTRGTDPIFRTVDGSNCDHNIDVSTLESRASAYSLLRTRGLIRIAFAVPANADYQVTSVNNPYGCNETDTISQYRRPLPATNLRFLSAVMFDGRESTPATGTTKIVYSNYPTALVSDLEHQSVEATIDHAQGDGIERVALLQFCHERGWMRGVGYHGERQRSFHLCGLALRRQFQSFDREMLRLGWVAEGSFAQGGIFIENRSRLLAIGPDGVPAAKPVSVIEWCKALPLIVSLPTCSGADSATPEDLAIPKSRILVSPLLVMNTLAGLISR